MAKRQAARPFIPPVVRRMLWQRWKASRAYVNNIDDPGRKSDPSFYHYRHRSPMDGMLGLSAAEAASLHGAGVFGGHSLVREDLTVSVNEHAQHALLEFLGEASEAWAKYQRRLEELPVVHA